MEVSNMNLPIAQIKKLASSNSVFTRGHYYWQHGYVDHVSFDGTRYAAQVSGSDLYDVTICIYEYGIDDDPFNAVEATCECSAYYSYKGYCKHIIAVLLEIQAKQEKRANSYEHNQFQAPSTNRLNTAKQQQMLHHIIDVLDKHRTAPEPKMQPYSNKETLQVEWTCHLNPSSTNHASISLSMRVGVNRLYVVRKINEFVKSIMQQTPFTFTSNFIYDPLEHQFEHEDFAIIQQLAAIMTNETFYLQAHYSHHYYASNMTEREMLIPPQIADQLLPQVLTREPLIAGDIMASDYIRWEEGIPPFSFELYKADEYTLSMKQLHAADFFVSYNYILFAHTLYNVPRSSFNLLVDLKKNLILPQLEFTDEQVENVVSHIVPTLRKVGQVEIAETISDRIVSFPLKAKMYLDYASDRLTAHLTFCYGETVIYPFEQNLHAPTNGSNVSVSSDATNESSNAADDTILLRDIDKEHDIMSIIESTALKWNGKEMYLNDEYDIFSFLYDSLPLLEDNVELYLSEQTEHLMRFDHYEPKVQLELDPTSHLLDVQFEMNDIEAEEIESILKSVVEKKRYYRLQDGRYVPLQNDTFQSIHDLIDELGVSKSEISGDHIQAPAYRGLHLENFAKDRQAHLKLGKSLRQLLEHIKHPEDLTFDLPKSLTDTLRDYQKTGFQWLKVLSHYHFGGILADDMGLGKTLQSIAYLLSIKEQNKSEVEEVEHIMSEAPSLIVCPASLIYNWKKEFDTFAPQLRVSVVAGDQNERLSQLDSIQNVDVLITSYQLLRRDIEAYAPLTFHTFILDEAQAVKNDYTQQAQAVKHIRAYHKFALTGTPIENSIDELWSIFHIVMPGLFPGKEKFRQLAKEKVARMVRPFILRRLKKDVLKELPDKIETVQMTELNKTQKTLYLAYLEKIQQEASASMQSGAFNQNRMKILAGLTRLRQLCCHPSLFIENYEGGSSKLEQLLQLVQDALESGRRLLIFSQFASMLRIMRHTLDEQQVNYFYLDGQTDKQERMRMTERFNAGEKDIFLISLKAGGTGLNLTGADTVILYDLWWNPAVDQQAVDRAHRMGQRNVVQVIRLISKGTIEERIYEMQQKKKELIEKVIQPGETMMNKLSEEDIKELLDI